MQYIHINNTNLKVSRVCLGTMTYGEQNTEEEAHSQLDYAIEKGINFIDNAEMYPVPRNEKTQGRTEEYLGNWLKKKGNRKELIIGTKIAGPDAGLTHIRDPLGFSDKQLAEAIDGSLKRLKTDYIDIYQLHWPERKTNRFSSRYYTHDAKEQWENNFREILISLNKQIKAGKIRYIGVSNETPWGLMSYLRMAEEEKLPRMISIQNAYNLLNRTFEYGLSEISMREEVGLLAYSPLAFGMLSGKYHTNKGIEKARLKLYPQFQRYSSENTYKATAEYLAIAEKHGLSLPQMALAYLKTKPFISSYIIGATTLEQLKENIDSIHLDLNESVLKDIEGVMAKYPDPAP